MARAKKSNKEKVQAEYPDFVLEVQGLQVADLERRISTYAKEAEKNIKFKEADTDLIRAREVKSELEAPYNDIKKAISMKIKFLCELVKEKGGDA